MRGPRLRRLKRRSRVHSGEKYEKSATAIQRCFQTYLAKRYAKLCRNYNDVECITLEPVSLIPRDVLIVIGGVGFDCRNLLQWLMTSNLNPLTRDVLPRDTRLVCLRKLHVFISRREPRGFRRRRRQTRENKLRALGG
ncbi:unknown [Feldmannia species virus]|uniref:Uncharacterized protein n=1 Tax=Feldmannia species virus TaxID=39420 RepID=B5LWH7_9PHYC|nr:hypothetical protein FeldSpV_gp088 [Feldmannia species virus]ACH46840.1 unknown [Feldmannia species virus]